MKEILRELKVLYGDICLHAKIPPFIAKNLPICAHRHACHVLVSAGWRDYQRRHTCGSGGKQDHATCLARSPTTPHCLQWRKEESCHLDPIFRFSQSTCSGVICKVSHTFMPHSSAPTYTVSILR
jgi:hypothetical protein